MECGTTTQTPALGNDVVMFITFSTEGQIPGPCQVWLQSLQNGNPQLSHCTTLELRSEKFLAAHSRLGQKTTPGTASRLASSFNFMYLCYGEMYTQMYEWTEKEWR